MKFETLRNLIVVFLLLFITSLLIFHHLNPNLFVYEEKFEFGEGFVKTKPLIAEKHPLIYWFYANQWIIFIFLILLSVLLTDWRRLKLLNKNNDK